MQDERPAAFASEEEEEEAPEPLPSQKADGPGDGPDGGPDDGGDGFDGGEGAEIIPRNSKPALEQTTLGEQQKKVDSLRVIEAALFLGNHPVAYPELAMMAHTSVKNARTLCQKLLEEYATREGAVEVVLNEREAAIQVKPAYLSSVASLSKQVEVSRKGMRMLGLIAKKGKLLQSELKKYFRGEIYAYIHELKELGYVTSAKHGSTRLLKPTEKFFENFQMAGEAEGS
ncbi:SMC-Scp complex subunit ScpB [Candidatus Micrarchaeota archaeon]|nr:SMC-Scp complex subunit ScpB [Candidatus Micrarchaeota archaeon]